MAQSTNQPMKRTNGHTIPKRNGTQYNSSVHGQHSHLDDSTDLRRWRLRAERGRQTWHYLASEEEAIAWPQTIADQYFLGLPMDLPEFAKASTPLESAKNAVAFFSKLQLSPGNWACYYGGPLFLLPGLVITWYVTNTAISDHVAIEIKRYLFSTQNPDDGGWGLHTEGQSTVYGTSMNYVILRILGASEEDPRMVKARGLLHQLGGAVNGPHWAKFYLAVLGVMEWSAVNPVPPELWLLPDWVPIAPWRWWIHIRMVFLPMSYIYSRKFSFPLTPLTRQLREELFTQPYSSVTFAQHRNSISARDNYHPKSAILNIINWILVNIWIAFLRTASITKRAEEWTYNLVRLENENTDFSSLAPVSGPMNLLVCYLHDGPDSYSVKRLRERMNDFMWMTNDGMLMNGTNGVQTWDTSFLVLAVLEADLAEDPQWRPMMTKALGFLDDQQIKEECVEREKCYRQTRKGAWAFSTREQGYTVADGTSEALKSAILLQRIPGYPELVTRERMRNAIDVLLTMQNGSGGFSSYEPIRGSEYLEYLNAAEVFGRIMIEYDYPECTTAVVTALSLYSEHDPEYRTKDIARAKAAALKYIRKAQRADGSWYGSWGICFTYAGMFALESLASVGEVYSNSVRVRHACKFLVSKQMADGGWGESFKSCETGVYVHHEQSQVVQTCWALLGLMEAEYPQEDAIENGIRLVMRRQRANGGWEQESIEGIFNKSCTIAYPNYKYYFPIKALGKYVKTFGNRELCKD